VISSDSRISSASPKEQVGKGGIPLAVIPGACGDVHLPKYYVSKQGLDMPSNTSRL
jgi:hypothetical protein